MFNSFKLYFFQTVLADKETAINAYATGSASKEGVDTKPQAGLEQSSAQATGNILNKLESVHEGQEEHHYLKKQNIC